MCFCDVSLIKIGALYSKTGGKDHAGREAGRNAAAGRTRGQVRVTGTGRSPGTNPALSGRSPGTNPVGRGLERPIGEKIRENPRGESREKRFPGRKSGSSNLKSRENTGTSALSPPFSPDFPARELGTGGQIWPGREPGETASPGLRPGYSHAVYRTCIGR